VARPGLEKKVIRIIKELRYNLLTWELKLKGVKAKKSKRQMMPKTAV